MRSNFHIYPTTLTNESRMMKETTSIIELGLADHIEMVGVLGKGLEKEKVVDENRKIVRLNLLSVGTKGKLGRFLFYAEAYVRYFFYLVNKRITVLNCHSLMMLPVAVIISKLKNTQLIYDTHELESERSGLAGFEKRVSKFIEKKLIKYCTSVVTVGPEITKWYKRTYGLERVYTVRNIPSINLTASFNDNILRDHFKIGSEQILFIYQGYFLKGRGIEILLAAFSELPPAYHVVFMGEGALQPEIEKAAASHENIHLQRTVPYEQILRYTSGCDIGISLFENTCLSHYYVLPNKLFEYIKSHLPILVSDFPEMQNVVQMFGCGWTVSPDKESVVKCISKIDKAQVTRAKKNAKEASYLLHWKNEEAELQRAFAGN